MARGAWLGLGRESGYRARVKARAKVRVRVRVRLRVRWRAEVRGTSWTLGEGSIAMAMGVSSAP